MIRLGHKIALILASVILLFITTSGGVASADPADNSPDVTNGDPAGAQQLPKEIPSNLKQFIAGTPEFKAGPWFKGPCADKGGDFAAYQNAVFPYQARLYFYSQPIDDQAKQLHELGTGLFASATGIKIWVDQKPSDKDASTDQIKKWLTDGRVVAALPGDQFPGTDSSYYIQGPVCANDLQRWTQKSMTTWGFQFEESPDATSLENIRKTYPNTTDSKITNSCGQKSKWGWAYCRNSMWVNCDHANGGVDASNCMNWNLAIGHIMSGTRKYADKNTSYNDYMDDFLNDTVHTVADLTGITATAKAFSWLWNNTVGPVVDFVKGAKELPDKWANYMKSSVTDMAPKVLHGLSSVGEFDFNKDIGWFASWYAIAEGLGICLMTIMLMFSLWHSSSRKRPIGELVHDLFFYMPAGIVLMMFTPAAAAILLEFLHALTEWLTGIIGTSTDQVVNNVSAYLGNLTNKTLVGGTIVGIIMFFFLLMGLFALYFGLLLHQVGMPVIMVGVAIAYGLWVHPKWRAKALRPIYTFVGLALSKPVLFLLIGVVFAVINSAASSDTAGGGALKSLGTGCLLVVAFMVLGAAPWALLKYTPFLPTASDAEGFGSGGIAGGVIGGAGSAAMMMAMGRGGGGGGGGGGHAVGSAASSGGHAGGGSGSSAAAGTPSSTGGHHQAGGAVGSAATKRMVGGGGGHSGGHGALATAAMSAGKGAASAATFGTSMAAAGALATAGAGINKAQSAANAAPPRPDESA